MSKLLDGTKPVPGRSLTAFTGRGFLAGAMPKMKKNLDQAGFFMNAVVDQNRRVSELANTLVVHRRAADVRKSL